MNRQPCSADYGNIVRFDLDFEACRGSMSNIERPKYRPLRNRGLRWPSNDEEDTRTYLVVMNHEEQYSIWLKDKQIPLGWHAVGMEGVKSDCLAYIDKVWADMRPLSLRKKMEEDVRRGQSR